MKRTAGMRKASDQRIDLGIAISGATLAPGEVRSQDEIAAFAGCARSLISYHEARALRKIRCKISDHPILSELTDFFP